jgi:mRNA interferase RelE/StbE
VAHYRIEFAPPAVRELRDLPKKIQARIKVKIDALALDPRPRRSEKLKGVENQYRIRSGDYRVIYSIEDDRLVVLVLRIGNRHDVYQGLK